MRAVLDFIRDYWIVIGGMIAGGWTYNLHRKGRKKRDAETDKLEIENANLIIKRLNDEIERLQKLVDNKDKEISELMSDKEKQKTLLDFAKKECAEIKKMFEEQLLKISSTEARIAQLELQLTLR